MAINVSDVVVTTASGTPQRLGELANQVLLIVNVASRCGFTRQYAGLEQLQQTYGPQGLVVLGFPCNDFGAQEPGTLEEIQTFCSTTYGATFPLSTKRFTPPAPRPLPTTCSPRPNRPAMWPGTSRSSSSARTARCWPATKAPWSRAMPPWWPRSRRP